MFDLHMHSTFSDGTETPLDLCEIAKSKNLKAIALTDHDTTDGLSEFLNNDSILIKIPGVEISLNFDRGTFHLLGLCIDQENWDLKSTMEKLKIYRRNRNKLIFDRLSEMLNRNITHADIAGGNAGELGRPHIAKFLVKNNIVGSVEEGFEKYLKKGKELYVEKKRLEAEEAIAIIKNAGGLSVLAHPVTLGLENKSFEEFVISLKRLGLDGIEAFCPLHDRNRAHFFYEIALKHDLIPTAGSDYHGDNKEGIQMGDTNVFDVDEKALLDKIIHVK